MYVTTTRLPTTKQLGWLCTAETEFTLSAVRPVVTTGAIVSVLYTRAYTSPPAEEPYVDCVTQTTTV